MPAWVVVWIVGVGGIMGEREAAVAWWRAVSGRGSLGSGGGQLLDWLGERLRLEWPGERSRVKPGLRSLPALEPSLPCGLVCSKTSLRAAVAPPVERGGLLLDRVLTVSLRSLP